MSEPQIPPLGRPHQRPVPPFSLDRKVELTLLLFILRAAPAMRLWRLESVPPGFTHDEAGHGHDAVAILHGARPLYQTVGYGREPLYDYVVAALMDLLGPTGDTLRWASVLFGLLTLSLTFAWTRLVFDPPTALATLALQAVSFWSLSVSRQALRSALLAPLFAAAVYFFWRWIGSTQRPRRWHAGLCAVFVGATLYTYLPARVLWVVFPVFLVYLALFQRALFSRVWRLAALAVLAGLLLAAPLFVYLQTHPGVEQRLGMLDAPLQALRDGDVSVILNRAQGALAAFLIPGRGDDFLAYAIPGRPVFDPLTGLLFLAGLGLCLVRWREPACAFALIWFGVGISPSLITGATASSTRSIGALPVAFLFPALAVMSGARWALARWGTRGAWGVGAALAGLLLVTGTLSAQDYFVTWGESADVRAAYQHTLVEMAAYLQARPEAGGIALSSVYPGAPHDPYVFELALGRRDPSWRWFDARRALLLPSEAMVRLLVPSSAALDPYFADLPGLRLRERAVLRPDDLDPFFLIYDWEPPLTLTDLRQRAAGAASDPALPVNFGDVVQLLGYDLRTPAVSPGGSVELVTVWQVSARVSWDGNAELVLFTHALGEEKTIVGQEDRLDAPAWDWQPGDVIAQIHRFALPGDLPPGPITLEVGAYRRADLTRLPVLVDGAVVGDRALLEVVEVLGQ
jgi:hypothetical protein